LTRAAEELVGGWLEFLGRVPSWDLFATLTFRPRMAKPLKLPQARPGRRRMLPNRPKQPGLLQDEACDYFFRLWISRINRVVHGPGYKRRRWGHERGIVWIRAAEPTKQGKLHYHAVLSGKGLAQADHSAFARDWQRMCGFARLEAPRGQESVSAYVSKYVVKDGELDVGGPTSPPRPWLGHALAGSPRIGLGEPPAVAAACESRSEPGASREA